jgi:hypothetical protein
MDFIIEACTIAGLSDKMIKLVLGFLVYGRLATLAQGQM